ncbi:MAG TPA: hypothetical protein V6D30_18650 [Leptolyngbyaceae cyanobacterium]
MNIYQLEETQMLIPGIVLFVLGILLAIIGGFWTLILAFMDNIVWGLASFFLPFAALVFIFIKWSNKSVRRSFLLSLSGLLISLLGSGIMANSGVFSAIKPTLTISQPEIYQEPTQTSSPPSPPIAVVPKSSSHTPIPVAQADPFGEAVNTAMSAAVITQSAIAKDDWDLVVNKWNSAITLLKKVPKSSPNYAKALAKVQEYERNLNYAQQQAANKQSK